MSSYYIKFGSCGRKGTSRDNARFSASCTLVCGITAIAFVKSHPGIGMTVFSSHQYRVEKAGIDPRNVYNTDGLYTQFIPAKDLSLTFARNDSADHPGRWTLTDFLNKNPTAEFSANPPFTTPYECLHLDLASLDHL